MPKDIPGVMSEFKSGELHSGSKTGPVVRNRRQAVAIAISEQKKMPGGMPKRGPRKFRRTGKTRVDHNDFPE